MKHCYWHLKEDKFLTSQAPSKAAPVSPPYTSGPKLPHCIQYTSGPQFPTEFKAGQQVKYQCILQLLLTLLQVSNFSPRYWRTEQSQNIGLFQLLATLKQGAPPEVMDARLLDPPTNDTCHRHIFKVLHSTVQKSIIQGCSRSCAPEQVAVGWY